jgi:hypothetical protein
MRVVHRADHIDMTVIAWLPKKCAARFVAGVVVYCDFNHVGPSLRRPFLKFMCVFVQRPFSTKFAGVVDVVKIGEVIGLGFVLYSEKFVH